MKYLFFDIECSNCFQGVGKMCEFGYVLTDENLVVMKCGDIPMSPGKGRSNRFNLTGRKHEKDLQLAYSYDFYFSQPEFPFFYDQIKRLVEDPSTICFAYSMDNDIPHLYNSCKRYGLEPFDYVCYDVQKLVVDYLESKKQISLANACHEIVGRNSTVRLQEHLSRDDAEMERLILDAICALTNQTPSEVLDNPRFTHTTSTEFMKHILNKAKKKKQADKGHKLYRSLLSEQSELEKPENVGRRYNISGDLKANLEKLKETIKAIKDKNGLFSDHLSLTDYFVVLDDNNKKEIIEKLKSPYEGVMLTYDEFVKGDE